MCVIIHKPKGVALDEKYIREGARVNRHGYGLSYYDPDKKEIIVEKKAEYDINDVVKQVAGMQDKELLLHFRISTHGSVKDENCHPFPVLDKKHNPMAMWMMHNGTIHKVVSDRKEDETDTAAFIRKIVVPLVKLKPGILRTSALQELFHEYVGASKLAFMFGAGEVVIVNKTAGYEREGCWYSNNGAFPSTPWVDTFGAGRRGRNMANRSGRAASDDTTVADDDKLPRKFLGIPTIPGDKVHVWDQQTDVYLGEGTIKSVLSGFSVIEIILNPETTKTISVENETGESTMQGTINTTDTLNRYYCMPDKYFDDGSYTRKTVGQITNVNEEEDTAADKAKDVTTADDCAGEGCICGCANADPNVVNLEHKRTELLDAIRLEGEGGQTVDELVELQKKIDERINLSEEGKKKQMGTQPLMLTDRFYQIS